MDRKDRKLTAAAVQIAPALPFGKSATVDLIREANGHAGTAAPLRETRQDVAER